MGSGDLNWVFCVGVGMRVCDGFGCGVSFYLWVWILMWGFLGLFEGGYG